MFLIDAYLRTSLVVVAQARGHQANHVTCLGLGDDTGCDLMPRIVAGDFTFATNDARDFHKLYAREEIHVGLVIIVPQVLPARQCVLFDAVSIEAALVNEVIEIVEDTGEAILLRCSLPI
ncbi:DUF5615 family PIN-like protein [Xanthobacter autotrophicus DSM 431]|uniref:DUF5615 family PIN-like protein n=1 Tax=Xanthobacter nonsaccharivorans TaxID=3119912 RepID=UPI00372B15E7